MGEPLEEELLRLFERGTETALPEAEFNRLALAVFGYQVERNAPYGAYCRLRGKTPDRVTDWRAIPALPTNAFKAAELTTVPAERIRVEYRTSGTTHGGLSGRHLLPDTRLYDASLLPNFQAHLLPDVTRIRVLICGPSAEEFPHSSLGHMNSRVREAFGTERSGSFWTPRGPLFPELQDALMQVEQEGEPVCILGTAFGLVHFLDGLADRGRTLRLPPGSRLMDTGGYKGRSREVPKAELYALYAERLGIPPTHVVNEYGMTELGSQFYDGVLRDWCETRAPAPPVEQRRKQAPPWVRVQVVDPESLAPLPAGEVGLLRFFDLTNLHTVAAVQTDDLGVERAGGFEILGRASGAEPRGCSLAVEEFVSARHAGE